MLIILGLVSLLGFAVCFLQFGSILLQTIAAIILFLFQMTTLLIEILIEGVISLLGFTCESVLGGITTLFAREYRPPQEYHSIDVQSLQSTYRCADTHLFADLLESISRKEDTTELVEQIRNSHQRNLGLIV